jgi:hypothetical protein
MQPCHAVLHGADQVRAYIFECRQALQPIPAGFKYINPAMQGRQQGHQGLGHVTRTEHRDVPRLPGHHPFEQKRHFTAAGHADIALQVPCGGHARLVTC